MANPNSFEKFIETRYYEEIFSMVKSFLLRNKSSLSSYTIPYTSSIKLEDIHVEGVSFNLCEGSDVEFRISVLSDVSISGKSKYDYESDGIYVWVSINCMAVLKNGLNDVQFNHIEEYSKAKFDKERKLSRYLIPYLYSEDADKVAEEFLHKHCPKALLSPIPIPIHEIVSSLGLVMYYAPLGDNVFGCTYFDTAVVTVYEDEFDRTQKDITIHAGTILINPDVYFLRNIGTVNNTIIHECVHWERHRLFFELNRLLNQEYRYISCQNIEGLTSIKNTALDWIEWQANTLAPKILLPASTVKKYIKDKLHDYRRDLPTDTRDAEIMELVIKETAHHFGVSVLAAKLRAIELGFEQAQGVLVYVDGKYIKSFAFASKSMEKNSSFVIDSIGALMLILTNPSLDELYEQRKIVFVNNMFCINSPKYITRNHNGRYEMTSYALDHVDECCFLFNCKNSNNLEYDDSYYRTCFLCREISAASFIESTYSPNTGKNAITEKEAQELQKVLTRIDEEEDVFSELPGSFYKTVDYHIRRKGITEEELRARSQISTQTISELRNKRDKKVDFKTLMKLVVGLNLSYDFCEDLIRKADVGFPPGVEGKFFKWLIREHTDESLEKWQLLLDNAKINTKLYEPK